MQSSGIPDRYVCHTLWHGWMEFKGEVTRITKLQKIFIRDHNARQLCSAVVVRFPDRVEDYNGLCLIHFDGTGYGLLVKMARLCHHVNLTMRMPNAPL